MVNIGGDEEIGRSVCFSIIPCVYMMTHNSASSNAGYYISPLSPAAKRFFFFFSLSLL